MGTGAPLPITRAFGVLVVVEVLLLVVEVLLVVVEVLLLVFTRDGSVAVLPGVTAKYTPTIKPVIRTIARQHSTMSQVCAEVVTAGTALGSVANGVYFVAIRFYIL